MTLNFYRKVSTDLLGKGSHRIFRKYNYRFSDIFSRISPYTSFSLNANTCVLHENTGLFLVKTVLVDITMICTI